MALFLKIKIKMKFPFFKLIVSGKILLLLRYMQSDEANGVVRNWFLGEIVR